MRTDNLDIFFEEEAVDCKFSTAEDWYYKHVLNGRDVLPSEKQIELAIIYQTSKDKEQKEYALNELIVSNQRLVTAIAKKHITSGVELEDLIQEGNLGLMKAIQKFDPNKGYNLSTYSTWWIRQAITRSIQDTKSTIRVPVHMREKLYKFKKVKTAFAHMGNTNPSIAELALAMNCSEKDILDFMRYTSVSETVSMSSPISPTSDEDADELQNFIPDESSQTPLENFLVSEQQELLLSEMSNILDERSFDIICRRFALNGYPTEQTFSKIAEHYNLSRERIRQIAERSLFKLSLSKKLRLSMGLAPIQKKKRIRR